MIGRFSQIGAYKDLFDSKEVLRVLVGGLCALVGFLLPRTGSSPFEWGDRLIFLSVAINGLPIIWGAVSGIVKKKINVDELVSIALIASLVSGEFLSAAIVSFVMMAGALIEEATGESARRAIQALVKITPREATVIINGVPQTKPISNIRVDDILLVSPGERIPVDGSILSGITKENGRSYISGMALTMPLPLPLRT